MTREANNYDNLLTAFKPRPWGEEINNSSQGYARPDPSSKTHIPSRESVPRSTTGASVIPWNYL
jgi:hypothetical protein